MSDVTTSADLMFANLLREGAASTVPLKMRVPLQYLRRDLTVAAAAFGGYLTGRETMDVTDILRPWNPVFEGGARVISGLTGAPDFPIVKTGTAASWLTAEGVSITAGQPLFGDASMTPKHAAGFTPYSRQLFLQAPSTGVIVRDQLLSAVADLLGAAAIAGTGASGQPTGLLNTAGVGSVAGGSLDHADILEMRRKCIVGGARETSLKWIGAAATQELLGARTRAAAGDRFLWDDNGILGREAYATAACPAATLVCGPWDQIVVGIWGNSFAVEIDPFHDFRSGKVAARIILECDVVCLAPAAFSVATAIT